MDVCVPNNFVKLETKSEFPRRRELKRPIPFGSENLVPPKKSKKSEERSRSYIHQSKFISDRYENLTLIGKGSFGMVYRAVPKDSSRKYVAIKEILKPITGRKDDQHHVVCEIELVQKLGGKNNILQTFEVYRDLGAYIVMEYFPHDDFKTIVKDMDASEIIMYIKNLVSALQYLHQSNIIHRDTKPDNFLYNRKQRRYALIDFGLAQYYNNNLDRSEALKRRFGSLGGANNRRSTIEMPCLCEGKLISPCSSCQIKPEFIVNKAGTPRFLAPEVLIGVNKQTTKIDIWAAGMMLFYLITRKYPFFHAKDNLAMVAELAAIFGTQSFIQVAKEHGMDLTFGFSFRSLNIIQFAFSHRYKNSGGQLSIPIHCDYCNEYFQGNTPVENQTEIGCFCRQMEISESSQTLNDKLDQEMAEMLASCLQVNPMERISSDEFVNKFNKS
uniref:Protein kinase domain-containing protein n=1 Tax=Panagrolaimus sp. PS1159 TaxID=55785 RepID=A0AC35G3T8_9BILA